MFLLLDLAGKYARLTLEARNKSVLIFVSTVCAVVNGLLLLQMDQAMPLRKRAVVVAVFKISSLTEHSKVYLTAGEAG